MCPNLKETAHLFTFTEKVLYGKLHFLCDVLLKVKFQISEGTFVLMCNWSLRQVRFKYTSSLLQPI